jgi:DNA-binding NarL/FixJ family response regulator
MTRAVEPVVLIAAVDAICAIKSHDERAVDYVAALEDAAFSTGAVDLFVTAYRAAPELFAVLLRASRQRDRISALMKSARDQDLAGAAGHPAATDDPRSRLSRRERDVYDLLCQGLTNRQIAELLFIEESTVKVHAHHIYDKLGTRSRTALAVQAALGRRDQATSATGESDTEAGS